MDITARINNHEKKRSQTNTASPTVSQSPAQPPQPVSPPSPSQEIIQAANTDDIRNVKLGINPVVQQKKQRSQYVDGVYYIPKAREEKENNPVVQQKKQRSQYVDGVYYIPKAAAEEEEETSSGNASVDWRSLDYESAVKYNPQLSLSQYISGASQYRKANNQEGFSEDELITLLNKVKDPYKSKEELEEEEKRMKKDRIRMQTGYYIDSIGNLLANLVNYKRATKGNPDMDLRGLNTNRDRLDKERDRLDKLQKYHDGLARSNYEDFMNKLKEQRAREAAATAAEVEFQRKLSLEQVRQNSPLTKKKEETEEERRKGLEANRKLVEARAEAQRKENESYEEKAKLEADYLKERIKSARNGDNKSGSRGKKQPLMARLKNNDSYSKDEYNLNDDKDVMKMYRQGVALGLFPEYTLLNDGGEEVLDPSKMDPDKLRNIILYSGKYVTEDDEDYDRVLSYPRKKPSLGWGVSSKNDKDEDQLDW